MMHSALVQHGAFEHAYCAASEEKGKKQSFDLKNSVPGRGLRHERLQHVAVPDKVGRFAVMSKLPRPLTKYTS